MTPAGRAPRLLIVLAFAAIYLLWGSCYLAIRWAVEELPPFWTAGARALTAGLILLAIEAARGNCRIRASHWRPAIVAGGLFFLGCHGLLNWAEQRADSGISALVLATIPIWIVVLGRLGGQPPPTRRAMAGLCLGFAGVALLTTRNGAAEGIRIPLAALTALLAAALLWALGSRYVRRAPLPSSAALSSALQLTCGGGLLWLVSLSMGEWSGLLPSALLGRSGLALLYLVLAGSLAGFCAYNWLLRVIGDPAKVGSYAFVNPLLAVLIGWQAASERVNPWVLASAALITGGVALIQSSHRDTTRKIALCCTNLKGETT